MPPNPHVPLSISLALVISMIDLVVFTPMSCNLVSTKVEHSISNIQALAAIGTLALFIYLEGDHSNEDDNDVSNFHHF